MDTDSQGTAAAPSQVISINGVDYAIDQASEYIEKGKIAKEYESKWNTPIDRLMPEYSRSREQIKTVETELEKARQTIATFQAKQQQGTETDLDIARAREAAKKVGLALNDDLSGYIKRDDLEKFLEERDTKREATQRVLSEADKFEKEIDGSDGRPAFNKKMVLAWANAYGHSDLQSAYKDMYSDQLKEWEKAQIATSKAPSLKTLKPTGTKKEPAPTKITDDNVKDMLHDMLSGSGE